MLPERLVSAEFKKGLTWRHSSTSSVKVPPGSMPIERVGVSRRSSGLNLKPPVDGFEAIFNNFPQHRNERPLGAGRRAIHV